MNFYKYPECEPLKTNYYLCTLKNVDSGFYQFGEILFLKGEGFKHIPLGMEIYAYTDLTPLEAAKNAQI